MKRTLIGLCLLVCCLSCEDATQKPIDGKTRRIIDSIRSETLQKYQVVIDSLCLDQEKELLPVYLDSIRRQREKEIREKLKNIPK